MAFTPHPLDRHRATLPLESAPLDKGGQGVVTRVLGPENLVYKEYMPQAGQVNGAALAELVEFGHRQTDAEVRALLGHCAWPVARVVHGGQVNGFLMPHVPMDFYGTIGGKPKLVELQYLLYEPNWAWQDLHQPDIDGRLEIATLAAKLIDLLHTHGWIVGDLSFRNLLWRPGRPYKVFMLDCDGLRRHGAEPVLRQAHTPDWNDPHQPSSGPELDTDRYKLALLIGRVLSRTASVRPGDEPALLPGLPDHVVTAVRELFTRAQGPRGTRPIAAEWVQALVGRKRIAVTRPPRPQRSVHTGPAAPMHVPGSGRVGVPVSRPEPGRRPSLSQTPASTSPERPRIPVSVPKPPVVFAPRPAPPSPPPPPPPARREPVIFAPRPKPQPPKPQPPKPQPPVSRPSAPPAVPTLGQRVVASDTYAEQRRLAPRGGVVDDDEVARLIDHLVAGTGRDSVANIAVLLEDTADRTVLLMQALKNLLNVEQTDVITLKDGDRTVELNVRLLEEQFLEEDEP
ncbi:hypothetical protein SAMN05421833_12830 [Microbispora rosea]|uniref:Alkaline phosphatase-like protein PglZ C-terminal domain-containing protein n=1 Tax=Microbispora rosea TaxID=58117 RepID=A0A1N7GDY5_9ACTN|nr:hypothetical protein [Microbispora rosea]GIH50630.1 hypothetical protein Mro03_58090 [Microbispora rosea subsp. rosea]SIS10835.1 hypothetical protein SAMN05421833_12830 [Microbispora rosea]